MKQNVQLQMLMAILAAGMMFSSCGNIDIIKRKYRPGFHVEVSKKRQKANVAEEPGLADKRSAEKWEEVETKAVESVVVVQEEQLTADATTEPVMLQTEKKEAMKDVLRSPEFEGLSFKRQMRTIQNKLFKPKAPVSDTHWMAWVSFGTGLGASLFGLIGFIVAFFGVTLWPLAIVLGAAAIVFAILHKNKGYSGERFRKLGLLFGIIGAGFGILGMIIWIIWAVGGFGGRYWWR